MSEKEAGVPARTPTSEGSESQSTNQNYSINPLAMQANYQTFLESLPGDVRQQVQNKVQGILRERLSGNPSLQYIIAPVDVLPAHQILNTTYPPPFYIVPQVLPRGLAALSGRPKIGKSLLALQLLNALNNSGEFLGYRVVSYPALYLAIEDFPPRLKSRMEAQNWSHEKTTIDFICGDVFREQIGFLDRGGLNSLQYLIEEKGYKLIVVDTLTRAFSADQRDEIEMTRSLAPLQEFALQKDISILLIDHHRKPAGFSPSPVDDILGSTAKAAVLDVIWGIYKEQGKRTATLEIVGRDVEEQSISLVFSGATLTWELAQDLPNRKETILQVVNHLGSATIDEIANAANLSKSHVCTDLIELANEKLVTRHKKGKTVIYKSLDLEE